MLMIHCCAISSLSFLITIYPLISINLMITIEGQRALEIYSTIKMYAISMVDVISQV